MQNLSQSQINRVPLDKFRKVPVELPARRATFGGLFAEKLANHIRETPMRKLARQFFGASAFAFLSFAVIAPRLAVSLALAALSAKGFILAKIATLWLVWRFRRKIAYLPRRVRNIAQRRRNRGKVIDKIPTVELVDYLVRNQNFRREGANGVRATFGLNMKRFNRLAKNLEKAGVLIRGENNLRILAPEWTRQCLVDFFAGKKDSAELVGGWLRIRGGEKIRRDSAEILKS